MKWFLYLMIAVSIAAYVTATTLETQALKRRAEAASRSEADAWREVQMWRATVAARASQESDARRQEIDGGGR